MSESSKQTPAIPSVRVFGAAVLRVAPDSASIAVAVTRTEKRADAAFAKAREAAQAVNAYLHKAGIAEFGSSRVTLTQQFRYTPQHEKQFTGYEAKIGFNVVLREVDKIDVLLAGLIDAGANELTSVTFETTRLKNLRAEVRQRAVAAARAKAELYCAAAGVSAGKVLAIEDVNPESLSGRYESHAYHEPQEFDDTGEPGAIDPGAIVVKAAVNLVYQIESPATP